MSGIERAGERGVQSLVPEPRLVYGGRKKSGGLLFFFFFQAEDGIRDLTVTGVQTCALPISAEEQAQRRQRHGEIVDVGGMAAAAPGKQRQGGGDTEHPAVKGHAAFPEPEIGRASCRERG